MKTTCKHDVMHFGALVLLLLGLLVPQHHYGQGFPNCDASYYDGVNLYPQGSYEDLTATIFGNGPIQTSGPNMPGCWRTVLFPEIPFYNTTEGYNALDNIFLELRYYYDDSEDIAGNTEMDPAGTYGVLNADLVTNTDYVASAMLRTNQEIHSDIPAVGLFMYFDNQDPNTLPPNTTPLTLQIDAQAAVLDQTISYWYPVNDYEGPVSLYFPTTVVGNQVKVKPGWHEVNQEFTVPQDYSNVMLLAAANAIHLRQADGVSPLVNGFKLTDVDDVCIMPKSANPVSLTIKSPINNQLTYRRERNITCLDNPVEVLFHIATSYVGTSSNVTIELDIPAGFDIVGGDGFTEFDANGQVQVTGFDETGIDVLATFNIDQTIISYGDPAVHLTANVISGGYLCHQPTATYSFEPTCIMDGNGDGLITAADLTGILSLWGSCNPPCGRFDCNGDGCITADDFTDFLGQFGGTCDDACGCVGEPACKKENSYTNAEIIELVRLHTNNDPEAVALVQAKLETMLTVQPNPSATGIFNLVSAESLLSEHTAVTVFDNVGRQLPVEVVWKGNGLELDLSRQPTGMYVVEVRDEHVARTLKLIRE